MSGKREAPKIFQTLFDILDDEVQDSSISQPAEVEDALLQLRDWQARRLTRTYADLLADQRYAPACQFFLEDIYGGRDFRQRDQEAEVIYERLSGVLPTYSLDLVRKSIQLNRMTKSLDRRLLQLLINQFGMEDGINEEMYVEAYRLCDNYTERLTQIDLFIEVLQKVGKGAKNPLVGPAIRLTRRAAGRAGFTELHSFLERGYRAFKPVDQVEYLVNTIQEREKRILDQIYLGDSNPLHIRIQS